MQNQKNPDGSYTYYIIDGNGIEIPVIIEPGCLADEMGEMDRLEKNQEDYIRQNRDERFEKMRRCYSDPNEDYDRDPLDSIPDLKVSIHEQAFGTTEMERYEVIAVRRVVKTLSDSRKSLFDQRYIQDISQSDIARAEGVTRAAVNKRDQKLREEVRRKLAEIGITEEFFDRRRL